MIKKIIYSLLVLIVITITICYFYLSAPVEVVLRDLDAGCNHDGRHFTITKIIDGRSGLLNKLVLAEGNELYEFERKVNQDSNVEIRVTGYYSIFPHNQNWAGCTGSHYFKIKKIVAITPRWQPN